MNLYSKLSSEGLKKHKNIYFPYILTLSFIIMSFTSLISLTIMPELKKYYGINQIQNILSVGCVVLFIFSCIFLAYCDGFLMEKRSDEYGLYGVLGLDKKQILKIVFLDSIKTFLISLIIGILFSVLFYKLETLLLSYTIGISFTTKFLPETSSIFITILVFLGIELFILFKRALIIKKSDSLELIKAKRIHKNPIKVGLKALLGIGFIGFGYYLALSTENPVHSLQVFFIAVLLVIIGTFEGFGAIIEFIIKILKKNKKFYYKPKNFTSISGIAHRISQSANGLASITIMSCATIVLLGSAFTLYKSADNVMRDTFPREIILTMRHGDYTPQEIEKGKKEVEEALEKGDFKKVDDQKLKFKFNIIELQGNEVKISDGYDSKKKIFIAMEDKGLKNNEIIAYSKLNLPKTLKVNGKEYTIIDKKQEYKNVKAINQITFMDTIVVEVNDLENFDMDSKITEFEMFNVNGDNNLAFQNIKNNLSYDFNLTGYSAEKGEFMSIFGSLIFIGVFLGVVFMFGTALVIYYKQLQEGYESKENFKIMRRVGMTEKEIKQSINSQVKTVFLLPPVVTLVHMSVAFVLINEMLKIIGMQNFNDKLTAFLTVYIVFILIYLFVYKLTSKTYYKVISEK